ncbi:hypothetical protein BJ508DRAFT_322949 [Ascobolus immersus RN42]|uniref:Uncharacterized protein n=1 Tax=Ascobolus immersus RN42 TaxID=1160509 RepID=A0A3N4ILV6_ASCIM|nr:hypothetical protein BJ508DRAFT_322949 [Ascobolus immersus RN42]
MPEVVDLLSSPECPPPRKKPTTVRTVPKRSLFDDDDDLVCTQDSFSSSRVGLNSTAEPVAVQSPRRPTTSSISQERLPDKPRKGTKRLSESPPFPLDARVSPKRSKSTHAAPIVLDSDDDAPPTNSTRNKTTPAPTSTINKTENMRITAAPVTSGAATVRKGMFDSDEMDIDAFLAKNTYATLGSKGTSAPSAPDNSTKTPEKPKRKMPLSPKPINVDETTPVKKDRTRELLDRLLAKDPEEDGSGDKEMASPAATPKRRKSAQSRTSQPVDLESPVAKRPVARKGKLTEEEKAERAAQKAAEKEAKDAEKARLASIKKAEKEAAASLKAQNARLREANKIRKAADSLPEMIIDLPQSFTETALGIILDRERLPAQPCSVKMTTPLAPLPVGHLITFRRKATARYDEASDMFLPIEEEIIRERHCLVHLPALDFLDMALHSHPVPLSAHFQAAASHNYNTALPIYLIEGLAPLIKKAANKKQRAFKETVRQMHPTASTAAPRRRKPANSEKERLENILDELNADIAEQALLQLQMLTAPPVPNSTPTTPRRPMIFHTKDPAESADWFLIFLREIARNYYKPIQSSSYNQHHIERGPAKCGNGPKDTMHKMLQEITRITPSIAGGIMGEFGSLRELWLGCRTSGEQVVEYVRTESARNGAGMAGKRVGIQGSRRVWRVFTSMDEDEEDI